MAVLGKVTESVVARLFPLAPLISKDDLQGASDWAEEQLERFGTPLPETGTRQLRELQRAVSAYALYLATGGGAASQYGNAMSQASAVKSFTIGPIKIERATSDTEKVGESLATSAAEWLDIATRHLGGVGTATFSAFAGVAR